MRVGRVSTSRARPASRVQHRDARRETTQAVPRLDERIGDSRTAVSHLVSRGCHLDAGLGVDVEISAHQAAPDPARLLSPGYCKPKLLRRIPPIGSRAYNAESLGPQRHQRIDPSGAARGKPARKRRYREQRRRNPDKRQWIRRRHAIQNSLHETRERQRGD
jgi:hypothetical protein